MFYSLDSIDPQTICPGYSARIYHGERITFAMVEAQPLARLPEHRHENEQVGLLVRGQLTFTIAGRETTVRGGDGWVIPGDVLHGAVAGPDGALVIETWGPPREDFRQLPPAAPGAARWPT